jgi:aerobic-type carbon monoxide dehydrogenase small subunit (CoxS/CutS family)
MGERVQVALRVNGEPRTVAVEPRESLADCLRERLGLTGTHVGCEHGVCGACTVIVNGRTSRACLLLAVEADRSEITTVEGVAAGDALHPVQQAFMEEHALQCGFCTPGFVVTLYQLFREHPEADEADIREHLGGNLCRCTGYHNILAAAMKAARRLREIRAAAAPTHRGGVA